MKTIPKEHLALFVPGKKINIPIFIGENIFDKISSVIPFHTYSSVLVILDKNLSSHWAGRVRRIFGKETYYLIISSGEKNKNLATIEKIWTTLSQNGFDRKSLVINMGGGMVCDIGAFAASTYMRGIPFVQVPTTLLAQADAAIGGKTGFNFNGLKNTIGTFSSPLAIISDTSFLSTLPQREFRSGFAEIIKHAIIADNNLFNYLLKKDFSSLKGKELDKILSVSCNIKCAIVRKDPLEKNERKKLNFGHTVGHAVEMACQDSSAPLLHGEAVAIGMIAEAGMAFLSGYLSEKKFREIENLIVKTGFSIKISMDYKNRISKKMLSDKKNVKGELRWVLPGDIGKVKVDVKLPNKIVSEGLNYILK